MARLTAAGYLVCGKRILDALLNMPGVGRPSAVAEWTRRTTSSVRKLMWEMAGDGQILGDGIGGYFLPTTVTPVTGNRGNGSNTETGVTSVTHFSGNAA